MNLGSNAKKQRRNKMAEMLSPGVYVQEIDASTIVPSVSNSTAVFAGNFYQGRVGKYSLITSVNELVSFYGLPSDKNFNDWYQAYTYLQYSNKLFLTRAANLNGSALPISGIVLTDDIIADLTDEVLVGSTEGLEVGQWISFGGSDTQFKFYEIKNIVANTSITVDRLLEDDLVIGDTVNAFSITTNGEVEASKVGGVDITDSTAYIGKMTTIGNEEDFEMKESSIAFVSTDSKFKFIARTPGKWSDKLEVAIANPASFGASTPVQAFDGIFLDDLFEYAPTGNQLGIIVRYNDEIKEIFTVSTDVNAKDNNNKSTYIETVINSQSNYIYVKDNVTVSDVKDYTFTAGKLLTFVNGKDSDIGNDDLLNAFELWSNKEEVDRICSL